MVWKDCPYATARLGTSKHERKKNARRHVQRCFLLSISSDVATWKLKQSSTFAMDLRRRLAAVDQRIRLKGDDTKHEQTNAWSNRDLIPLPSERRTWGWINYFGFWAIASLNVANWQTPSAFLGIISPTFEYPSFFADARQRWVFPCLKPWP